MALLEVKNLTVGMKKDGKVLKAVNNISFKIDEGEIAGIAGESGSGKSTAALSVINMLAHNFEILGGEIVLNSQKEKLSISGSEIGMIFQEIRQSLNPLMKIGDQITENISNNKREIKKLALDMLYSLGFEEPEKIFNSYPHQLSGGMCQRALTAIAAIRRPRLLLADEPSSALDEEGQKRILSFLLEMNREYKTAILIISHNLSIIRDFCSRFMIMYDGKIIEEGPSEALSSPLHPYTNALIGAIPKKEKRGTPLENIPGKPPSIEDNFSGCLFAPRCKKAKPVCHEVLPPEIIYNTEGNIKRAVYCHFPETGEKND